MDILITGIDGFIGGHLRDHLQAQGHQVFGTVYLRPAGANEQMVNICDRLDLGLLPRRPFDAVIHTAGIVDQTVPRKHMMMVNVLGTKNILAWAKEVGAAHFIHISSVSVYGLKTLGHDRSEANTKCYLGPFALPYMRTKALAEKAVAESGLSYTMLRLPAVLGRNDSFLTASVLPKILADSIFTCGQGDPKFSLLYVKSLGLIMERLLAHGPCGEAFNCVSHQTTWHVFAGEYARQLGTTYEPRKKSLLSIVANFKDKKFLLVATFSAFGGHYPSEKLFAEIGPIPMLPWQDGVKEALEGYLSARP